MAAINNTTTNTLPVGAKVAWTMQDGNTMAGAITFLGFDTYLVRRVDGGTCELPQAKAHPASHDEILSAIRFFRTLGR